jgi:hypothetical protein
MAVSKSLRFQIFRRDGHECRYCGRSAPDVQLTIDHVIATALGGKDEPGNLVTACSECNGGKSATPADAAIIDDVAQDAVRWARAQKVAARQFLDRLAARNELRATFKAEWDRWTVKETDEPIPLPDSWANTVDNLLSAGLPMVALIDSIDVAMCTEMVKPENTFRYMCGVAWNRVSEIQQIAAGLVGGDAISWPAPRVLSRETLREALAAVLDRCEPPLPSWEYDRIVLDALDAAFGPIEVEA